MEDVDPEADAKESVATKVYDVGIEEYDTDNSNGEAGAESGCESSKVVSIRVVGVGYCNSTI